MTNANRDMRARFRERVIVRGMERALDERGQPTPAMGRAENAWQIEQERQLAERQRPYRAGRTCRPPHDRNEGSWRWPATRPTLHRPAQQRRLGRQRRLRQ